MRVLVLQHDRFGGLGAYERVLTERRAEIELVELETGRSLPDWCAFDAILALGGQASIAAESPPAWLAHERRYLRDAVTRGVPYWGVCLGAQLLAASLGARVYPGPKPEVGIHRVSLTDAGQRDAVFRGAPRELKVFSGTVMDSSFHAAPSCWPGHPPFRTRRFAGVRTRMGSSSISRSRRRWPVPGPHRLLTRLSSMTGSVAIGSLISSGRSKLTPYSWAQ
jgi:GMP synthase-like glutamine amidotransferase